MPVLNGGIIVVVPSTTKWNIITSHNVIYLWFFSINYHGRCFLLCERFWWAFDAEQNRADSFVLNVWNYFKLLQISVGGIRSVLNTKKCIATACFKNFTTDEIKFKFNYTIKRSDPFLQYIYNIIYYIIKHFIWGVQKVTNNKFNRFKINNL